jgi:hypothetical protein
MAGAFPVDVGITLVGYLARDRQRNLLQLERQLLFDPLDRSDACFEIGAVEGGMNMVPEVLRTNRPGVSSRW